jgi:acyl-CoA synthetase (AMP-forming)/AMP-acid ligase II
MKNCLEYVVAMIGCFRAGLVAVPINARLHASELAFIASDSGASALLYGFDTRATIEACDLPPAFLMRPGVDGPGLSFEELLAAGGEELADADVEPTDLAWLFYTSGTTGRPKGAMLSHRNLERMVMGCLADICSFRVTDRVLHVAPLSHGSGLYLLPSLARGAENILFKGARFEADDVLTCIADDRVSVIAFLAPTMIVRLLHASTEIDTSSLRCVIYGGGPIHIEHALAAVDRFGSVFVQIYGQGEAPMTISYLTADEHSTQEREVLASAGIPRTDVEVAIVDNFDREVPVGEAGEVVVRGDVVMSGYWRNATATKRALKGGWLHTGDIGLFDKHGRLHLLDRKDDMIITGGSNVYPREVEDILLLHHGVREAAVFGVRDPLWGESVIAAVVPFPDCTLNQDDLIEHCRTHMASFKKPRRIQIVDELPKNAYGKIMRKNLRAMLEPAL